MAQLFETLCMMLAFKESHSLAVHYCRLVWDVRSLSKIIRKDHMEHCVVDAVRDNDKEAIEQLNKAINQFLK